MRNFLVVLLLTFASTLYGQITLEHVYPFDPANRTLGYAILDSNEAIFYRFLGNDTIEVYNVDHSLYKRIPLSMNPGEQLYRALYLSRHLFNLDDKLEILITVSPDPFTTRIVNEEGAVSFECKGCNMHYPFGSHTGALPLSVVSTQAGTKLILIDSVGNTDVFSLPGKLPGSTIKLGVTSDPGIFGSDPISTNVFPNPSHGALRIEYTLPESVSTAQLIITTTDGKEVKRFTISSAFNDLVLDKAALASGFYFYTIITPDGQSTQKPFVVVK